MSFSNWFANLSTKQLLAASFFLTLLIALIIYLSVGRGEKPTPKKNGSSGSNSNSNPGSYIVKPDPKSNVNSDCFYSQCGRCLNLSNANESELTQCMKCKNQNGEYMINSFRDSDPTQLGIEGCSLLKNNLFDQSDSCYNDYNNFYNDANCSRFFGVPGVITDPSKDRNNIQCGQDCSDLNKMSNCYAQFLNTKNQKCEFGSPKNSGDFKSNCHNYGESQNLLCNTALTQACQNVLTNATHCK
jgi:hypothetical protein